MTNWEPSESAEFREAMERAAQMPTQCIGCGHPDPSGAHIMGCAEAQRKMREPVRFTPLPSNRVTFTPGSISGVVVARKRYGCDGHLADERHYIEPGEQYVANALPPDNPDIGNDRWWHSRLCMNCCPARFLALSIPPGSTSAQEDQ